MSDDAPEPIPSSDFDIDRFREFLRSAKREVDSWPEWKKNTLGWWRSDEESGMSENESRQPERWSPGQAMWSGPTSDFVNTHANGAEIVILREKSAALDKILAAWGMTWDEYKQQSGTDAPDTVREPNAETQAVQSRDHVEHPA